MSQEEVQAEACNRLISIAESLPENKKLMKLQERGFNILMVEDRKRLINKKYNAVEILPYFIIEDTLTIPFIILK